MNTNPSDTNDVIGEYAQASSEHVNNALFAANRAVGEWGVSPMETRYQVLTAPEGTGGPVRVIQS